MRFTHEPTLEELERLADLGLPLLKELSAQAGRGGGDVTRILRRHPMPGGGIFSKALLFRVYLYLVKAGKLEEDPNLAGLLRVKRVRTLSGVAPVAVLTAPHPCPGLCLFCPSEPGLPKSYLSGEPGAMRALRLDFDPYLQVRDRIRTLSRNGHPTDKVELLVLGGTWSAYPVSYREEFLRRCLEAMNGKESPSLQEAQKLNEDAPHREVGLVVETRPDMVTPAEIARLRREGVTKVQVGAQSLEDRILERNRVGYTVEQIRRAVTLLKRAAFKVVLHWMPNLPGSDPARDLEDFGRLFADPALRPDELKIYPCTLVETAGLKELWERGEWAPYPEEELVDLVARCKLQVPSYCRINRVFRDIPAPAILAGCKKANLRRLAQERLARWGKSCRCLRCLEVRAGGPGPGPLQLEDLAYSSRAGEEHFLSFRNREGRVAGFLRLLLPSPGGEDPGLEEIRGAALVREVHVYGQALPLGGRGEKAAQHRGLGRRLMAKAEEIAREGGYGKVAVIAAVGTRAWYASLGYTLKGTYMARRL